VLGENGGRAPGFFATRGQIVFRLLRSAGELSGVRVFLAKGKGWRGSGALGKKGSGKDPKQRKRRKGGFWGRGRKGWAIVLIGEEAKEEWCPVVNCHWGV